ncbi:PIG-L family deacetylase [Vallitalea pronyensis]|uniref:PIG-L family deacetylase n=1 Tax=Vallitalea pronyensis TaxID=1348613 RepID=A0A8J8MI25_9FIRM|nr:PIG-L deacetylase family protein [Vallitalea pronyensis]QUI21841.1 PIG-L family deacetylase [Vallitalea pronyensis]
MHSKIISEDIINAYVHVNNRVKCLLKPEGKRILVIAPHPDDEVLGCGGTICKHLDEGDFVSIVYLTNGEKGGTSHEHMVSEQRYHEALKVLAEWKIEKYYFLDLGDQNIIITSESVALLRNIIHQNRIDLIYVPHIMDSHLDHFTANIILANALIDWKTIDRSICSYEVWSPLDANILINISNHIKQKQALLNIYQSQMKHFDFWALSRNLTAYRALASVRVDGGYIKTVIKERKIRDIKGLQTIFPWKHVEAFTCYTTEDYCRYVFKDFPDLRLPDSQ